MSRFNTVPAAYRTEDDRPQDELRWAVAPRLPGEARVLLAWRVGPEVWHSSLPDSIPAASSSGDETPAARQELSRRNLELAALLRSWLAEDDVAGDTVFFDAMREHLEE